jgi:HAD superfamily hydrolase (TIGR01450 family)
VRGAPQALAALSEAGIPVVFCTNHSRLTVEQYRSRLSRLGIEVGPDSIVTSAVATGAAVAARGLAGARALVIGQDGVREALATAGIVVEDDPERVDVDLVVVGWDDRFDYDAMRRAATAVRAGAVFIATNDDATLPRQESLWPGAGAICAGIAVAAGRRPEVIGKPHRAMMEAARDRLPGDRIAIVGDNPASDLAGGRRMGWTTVLVLSGITERAAAGAVSPAPDLVLESIADLPGLLSGARPAIADGRG